MVFVQGCPWRCSYCHNPHLQARKPATGLPWAEVLGWLGQRVGLLDAVVFSGGEPTIDPPLPQAMSDVRRLGFKVRLHTAGIFPQRLQGLLSRVDWVGLDIKAPMAAQSGSTDRHTLITSVRDSAEPVRRSLAALVRHSQAHGLSFECRTTAHPALLDMADQLTLADELAATGVRHWVLQVFRTRGSRATLPAVGGDYPAAETLAQLKLRLPDMSVRRG